MPECKTCKYYKNPGNPYEAMCSRSMSFPKLALIGTIPCVVERAYESIYDCGPTAKFYYPKNPTNLERLIYDENKDHK